MDNEISGRAPLVERVEARANKIWNSLWVGWFILVSAAVLSAYWFFQTPAPGYAVGALGGLAAIMTFREMKSTQKLICTLAIFALLAIELRAIKHDRDESAKAQSDARSKENKEFRDVFDSFARTERAFDSLHTRLAQSAQAGQDARNETNRQFAAMLERYRGMFNNITGADSYAYLSVQDGDVTDSGMALGIHNEGKYILTGVTVQIVRITEAPNTWDFGSGPQITIGTLYPGEIRMTGARIKPRPGPDGTDSYWVFVAAQNGLTSQMIWVRQRKDGQSLPWAHRSVVGRVTYWKKGNTTGTTNTPVMTQPWTDEPNAKRLFLKPQGKVFIP